MKTHDDVAPYGGATKVATTVTKADPGPPPSEAKETDPFQPLYSMDSIRALGIPGIGCLVKVTGKQGDTLTFVPGVRIVDDVNGGCKLRSIA